MKVFIILTACAVCVYGSVLDYFPHCKRSDPAIERCFRDGIEGMRSHRKKPLKICTLKMEHDGSAFSLSGSLKNIEIYGASDFKIENLRLYLNNMYKAEITITIPKTIVAVQYHVHPLKVGFWKNTSIYYNKGKINVFLRRISASVTVCGRTVPKGGKEYLQADKIDLSLHIGDVEAQLVFSDDKETAMEGVRYFNDHRLLMLAKVTQMLNDTGARLLKDYINEALSSVPIKEILLDDVTTFNTNKTTGPGTQGTGGTGAAAGPGTSGAGTGAAAGPGTQGLTSADSFPQCKRSDPVVESCFRDGIEYIRKHLKEPLTIPTQKVESRGVLYSLSGSLKNIEIYGAGDFKIEMLRLHLNNPYKAEITITIPEIKVAMEYDVHPLKVGWGFISSDYYNQGKVNCFFRRISASVTVLGSTVVRGGEEYLQADNIDLSLHIGDGEAQLAYSDDTETAMDGVRYFNHDPSSLLDKVIPTLKDTGAHLLKDYINEALSSVPIKEILLD